MEDKFQKPNFDARVAYIDVLKNYLNTIGQFQLKGDYDNLMIALRNFFIYSSPFNKKKLKIKEEMKKLRRIYSVYKKTNSEDVRLKFEDDIDEFQLLLMEGIKYILMPLRGDEDIGWDDFAERSDIQVEDDNRKIQ